MLSKSRRLSRSHADLTDAGIDYSLALPARRTLSTSSTNTLQVGQAYWGDVHSEIQGNQSARLKSVGQNLQIIASNISHAKINKHKLTMIGQLKGQSSTRLPQTPPRRRFTDMQDGNGSEFGIYISTRSSKESITPPARLYRPSSGRLSPNPDVKMYTGTGHNQHDIQPASLLTQRSSSAHLSPSPQLNISSRINSTDGLPIPDSIPLFDSMHFTNNVHPDSDMRKRSFSRPKSAFKDVPPDIPLSRMNPQSHSFIDRQAAHNSSHNRDVLDRSEHSPANTQLHEKAGDIYHSPESQVESGYTKPNHTNEHIENIWKQTPKNSLGVDLSDRLNGIFSNKFSNSFTPMNTSVGGYEIHGEPTRAPDQGYVNNNHSRTPQEQEHDLPLRFSSPNLLRLGSSKHTNATSNLFSNKGLHSSFVLNNIDPISSQQHGDIHQDTLLRELPSAALAANVYGEEKALNKDGDKLTGNGYNPEPDYSDSGSGTSFDSHPYKDQQKDEELMSFTKTNDDNNNEEEEAEDPTWRPYDVFTVSERECDDDNKVFKEILKVIRGSLYILFVISILVGTVLSRISLLLLASDISQTQESRGRCVVQIMICMCAPMLYSWFNSFMKILFGGKEWPSIRTFAVVMFFELVCTFGMCLLVFKILPSTDFFRGITITFAMFQIPSILKVMMLDKQPSCGFKTITITGACVLAMLIQCASLAYFMVMDFSVEKYHTSLTGRDYSRETKVSTRLLHEFVWELPVSLVLVSLSWWENYVSCDWSLFGRVKLKFRYWRHVLQETRETSNFLVTPFKIALVVVLGKYMANAEFGLPSWSRATRKSETAFHGISYSLLYIQLGSAVLCTYLAGLACKLHMQKTAFAVPLVLSPPVSLVVVYLQCRYQFLPVSWHTGSWYCPNMNIENIIQPIAVSGTLWLSYCIIVSHIWFPKSERMAKIERLFLTPHFSAIFPDFNLTLRRRRNDQELRASRFDHFTYVGDETADYVPHDAPDQETYVTPTIYVCATMWHETRREMTQLLKSLFRLDYGHCASKLAQDRFHICDPDYFDMEIHIIFDDAFELDVTNNKFVPNIFVRQFIDCMEEAARSVVKGFIIIPSPVKVVTPYGGRLVWTMPGQTRMVVHMKDKNKIRHRKRWSQVMYLYYLLGFRLLGSGDGSDVKEEEKTQQYNTNLRQRRKKKGGQRRNGNNLPLKQLLMRVPPDEYEQIIETSENIFILTLDGDVDFKPESVKLLVDRMKKNKKVGAVCGRIHPVGSGPMVWYQQFEYAVGHWLQKAAEHVLGCVLCCPGCFSLFRGSAIMDDNVLKMYTTKPTEARHFIQFEQGEDRWLCTLLLQQGHRIDYSAGADALTFAPETFNEFFNQRRRWSPSTLANMMDLLASWRDTVRLNDNISRLYILYQFTLMASSILAPSTVILMITSSYHSVLGLSNWWSFVLSMVPVAIYVVVCLTQKTDTQIKIGAVLTAMYTVIMMIATVGTVISIATENFSSPNVVFLSGLGIIFVTAALLHPQEIYCLVFGAMYFLVVPSTFILLTIFYLCNLNNVSWGTREVLKKLTTEEEETLKIVEEEKKRKKKSWNIFTTVGLMNIVSELRDVIRSVWGLRHDLQNNQNPNTPSDERMVQKLLTQNEEKPEHESKKKETLESVGLEEDPDNPFWFQLDEIGNGPIEILSNAEIDFWNFLIKKYLYPLEENKEQKDKIASDLLEVRNNVVFIFIMLNFLWTVISLQLQASEDILKDYYIIQKYEPMSLVFLTIFGLIMVIQFFGMIVHRWGTFLHLMSSTRIDWFSGAHSDEDFARFVVQEIHKHQNLEPVPDYADEEDEDNVSLPSHLGDTVDEDDLSSMLGSTRMSYTNQMVWPRNWNHQPSKRGHFPQYENILDHKLGQLQQQLSRAGSSQRVHTNLGRQLSKKETRFFNGWSSRDANMRQKFLQQNLPLPQQHPAHDRLSGVLVI